MFTTQLYALEITLKSGAKVEVEVTDASFEGGYGKTLNWTTPDNWRSKMLHVDLDEVAAVVVRKK